MKKFRKLAAIVVALGLVAGLSTTAFAAQTDLGAMNLSNGDTQQGWLTDGVDGNSSPLTAADFTSAKYLVLEFAQAPTGGMQVIWQGDGDAWAWDQTDGVIPNDGMTGTQLVVDLSSTLKNYDLFKASTQLKLLLGYYSNNIADLGITKAYLTDTDPNAGAAAPAVTTAAPVVTTAAPASNPQTGDNNMIFIALGVLAVAGVGAFVFAKKAKQN